MRLTYRRPLALCAAAALALAAPAVAAAHGSGHGHDDHHGKGLRAIQRIVVIYEENHSFDNLYGGWEGVNGLRNADPAHTTQVNQAGTPYTCLLQNDVNLASPPLSADLPRRDDGDAVRQPLHATTRSRSTTSSRRPRRPARRRACSPPTACWIRTGLPGGCTRDLVHRYYQEQYQLNGGKQNRYVTGSDAVGLTMGTYDTRALPIYKYLHGAGHPDYAIADDFFQAAFGGSFLNHQWLIAAATPTWPTADDGGADDLHSVVDANGMPNELPAVHSPPATTVKDTGADRRRAAGCDTAGPGPAATSPSTRSSRPYQPYAPGTDGAAAAAADRADDRRPPERQGHRLGVVLGRLVERRRRRRRAGLDQRDGRDLRGPQHRDRRGLPELPGQAVPVPPPAVQLLRHLRARDRPGRTHLRDEAEFEAAGRSARSSTASSSR